MTTMTPARPATTPRDDYTRSYLSVRTGIGVIGVTLPVLLMVGDYLFLPSGDVPRSSLSAYYHTGMRDVLVGALCAVAVFLVTYMISQPGWDNLLSTVAGLAAFGVALFPTAGRSPLTPLQSAWGENRVSLIHFICAAIFILSLAVISLRFGLAESPSRRGRRWLHIGCALMIVAAVAFMLLTNALHSFATHSIFWGETIATWSFGLSWLAKSKLGAPSDGVSTRGVFLRRRSSANRTPDWT
ncbi:hypothetical protein [Asanoa iriomotensis]|uniref:DUF998 domain-containing protein n=1 Tax=Asanoa iriomotensis TaxID=234613 RepID=A0ABQ4C9B4_9ACTN|nr:hypothetical protein [Asanoa iriomotensis]GIF59375.1 hypothetical protein Air01nite_54700 [Asanoa iriomotensis]